ncbi:MAG: homoserine dehydrogenase [Lachnospiraceae bacterium]|nr:homoserine dehydrogenase [Lachnospiraceae bacterium]
MIQMAVLGFGTVGGGVVELIDRNQEVIRKTVPQGIHVKYILDLRDFPDSPYNDRVTHDYQDILDDEEITVICETMGGKEPAYTFTKKALERGISVCTSNKELVAAHGPELLQVARTNNCSYLFEASVGGGIPLIRPINACLTQEDITEVFGILNGTTNYILTRMEKNGLSFEEALKEAQQKGYAERNPEADVEGHDACRKIAILSSLISGKTVRYEDIPCEGISRITTADFGYARAMKMAIKLLGVSRKSQDGSLSVRTAPFLVKEDHPLHSVQGVFNGVFVHGNMVDDLMFYGRGAGKFPTASAVVSDVMECAKNIGRNVSINWTDEIMALADSTEDSYRYFVRVDDSEAAVAAYTFKAANKVSFEGAPDGETAFVTAEMTEKEFAEIAKSFKTIKQCIRLLQD